MSLSFTKQSFVVFLCLVFLSAQVGAESYRSSTKKSAKAELEYYSISIDRMNDGGRICSLGIRSSWDETFTRVSDIGASKGFRPGDKLIAINDTKTSGLKRMEALSKFAPSDLLVVSIERDGTKMELETVCDDGTEVTKAIVSMLKAATKGRWQECIDWTHKADRLIGEPTWHSASQRAWCSESIRCGSFSCKTATTGTASLLYDQYRLAIEESSVAGRLDEIRSDVLSSITWLENAGYRRFANELESELREAESPPARVADRASPSEPTTGYGTCFAVSDSEVLTSHHVVEGASIVTVVFQDGVEKGAIVLEQSQSTDLALLRINGTAPAFLPLSPMRSLKVGQEVFTVGFPVTAILGTDAKFTEGSVSSLSGIQNDSTFFQMSVPVQPGNSGGPVVSNQGEVVGIVTATAAIEAFYAATGSLPQNINWASKSDYAQLLFDAPNLEKRANDRAEAIEMTYAAICKVTAVKN